MNHSHHHADANGSPILLNAIARKRHLQVATAMHGRSTLRLEPNYTADGRLPYPAVPSSSNPADRPVRNAAEWRQHLSESVKRLRDETR